VLLSSSETRAIGESTLSC